MKQARQILLATIAGLTVASVACTQKTTDEVLDSAKQASEDVADAAGDAAERTADKTKEIARDLATSAGEAITDSWITAKVSAKFSDETLLEGSRIDVDTDNHVVTLKGTVTSVAARSLAASIAGGTEGVTRVINQLVVS